MEKPQLKRNNKYQRPSLTEYIKGNVRLEDLVGKEKIVKSHERHRQQAILASINSIEESSASGSYSSRTRCTNKTAKNVNVGKTNTATKSSHPHSKAETIKTGSGSGSVHSEHSAQGDTPDCNRKAFSSVSTVSKSNSVIVDRMLNKKDAEIKALKEEIRNVRQTLNENAQFESDIVSVLQKLIDDLSAYDANSPEPPCDKYDVLAERLRNGVQTLRVSYETTKQKNIENDEKLAQFRANNELLQKRVATLESDLQQIIYIREHQQRQLVELSTQNDKLRADLDFCRKTHASGIEMCTKLQCFVQHEFKNKMHRLQNYDTRLQEHAQQLEHAFDKLEEICRRHIRWMKQIPSNEIERLKTEIHESELTKMRQVCELATEYTAQMNTNKALLNDSLQYKAFLVKLNSENHTLKFENQYLKQQKDVLEEICRKKIDSLTAEERLKTLITINKRTLDVEKERSQQLINHIDETVRVTNGLNDE